MTNVAFRAGAFEIGAFLRDTWQQAPLLMRNPWAAWSNPVAPDELAGLACEDGIEARLIRRTRTTFEVEHGPFADTRFARLGKQPWTLLVQAVDHHVPDVAALIAPFRFVPNWRIDDVMVSYASDGGGVGAHFDRYDVFLVQGLGLRRWRIGVRCDAGTELLPHDDLRLLARFEAVAEWVLEPGDVLYVPPGYAHEGTALGDDCMTYSIGFHAPSRADLIAGWCDHLLGHAPDDAARFRDEELDPAANPGEITPAAIARLHTLATDALRDRDAFARWFGRHDSTRKYPDIDWSPDRPLDRAQLDALAQMPLRLERNPASRFAFIRQDGAVVLFVDGVSFACAGPAGAFAEALCARNVVTIEPAALTDTVLDLIVALYNQGSVAFDEP